MKVLKWSLVGGAVLLLVCQVAVSQLCRSVTVLMDGFHTLFILIGIALTSEAPGGGPPGSSLEFFASPDPSADPPAKPRPPGCGLSYRRCRVPVVGSFVSALVLASLCLSSTIDVIGLFLEPRQVWLPLLLVLTSSYSVLLKTLFLWLHWDQLGDASLMLRGEGGVEGRGHPGRALGRAQYASDDSLLNGALVLCNPATSGLPEGGDGGLPPPPAAAEGRWTSEEGRAEAPGGNDSPSSAPSPRVGGALQKPACGVQVLGAAVLALINSVALLVSKPQCLGGPGPCSLTAYLDPCFSLLAMLILFATCIPQVSRHGMLLLQAAPPDFSVPDLRRRIESVPGVQAVHDLHIWELTEVLWVASVHLHCHADFKSHRCADLMSEVLKVLQSVGVSCCTIQPEFAPPSSGPSASPPRRPSCSLACAEACASSVCCTPSEEEKIPSAPQRERRLTDSGV